ncbi:MAG: pyruvate kinase [Alkalispirochaetaceae bacterium]
MPEFRKTKIVCTLGPAVDKQEIMEELLKAGMNIARFNLSHGDHEEHRQRIAKLRAASDSTGIPVALLLDTKGPEIRTGTVRHDGTIDLPKGHEIILTTEEVEGDETILSVSYEPLPREVHEGGHIYIADGLIDLEVKKVEENQIHCVVRTGGSIGSRKNVNVPGVRTSLPAITDKDIRDILFAVDEGFDFIAASFVRKPQDITAVQDILEEHESPIRVIAKIEDQEGLENIEGIVRASSGVMVARGDLGVQLATEQIPLAQKRIIQECNRQNRPVITATQMLDSMIQNPRPTRAELTDVANAIFDGTDAVMLSGETASGKYPVDSVLTLHRIALAVESSEEYKERSSQYFYFHRASSDIGDAIAKAAYLVASDVEATAIVSPTLRGNSPRRLSKFRPTQTIIAATISEVAYRQLLLHWGIHPLLTEHVNDSELMTQNALSLAMKHGFVRKGEKVVSATGIPLNSPIPMNSVKVHFLGNILNRGAVGLGGRCSGNIVKARSYEEAKQRLKLNGREILLTEALTPQFAPLLLSVRGLIVEHRLEFSTDRILELNADIVCVAEVRNAYEQFEHNQIVSLDGEEKIVYEGILDA